MANYSDIFPVSLTGGSIAGFDWEEKTADFVATANKAYYCDTALGDILLTLPSSPSPGDEVGFLLIGANKVNVTSGDKIKGSLLATDFVKQASQQYLLFVFFYVDATTGWDWNARYDSYISNGYIGTGDPYVANVVLFLKGDGANGSTSIVDSSPTPKTISVIGNTQLSTAQSKYGGSSIYFDGSGDRLDASNGAFIAGTSSFTFESWYYMTIHNGYRVLLNTQSGDNTTNGYYFGVDGSGKLIVYTNSLLFTGAITVPLNAWCHIAFVRINNTISFFVDGIKEAGSLATTLNQTQSLIRVGGISWNNSQSFLGYKDSVRYTIGVGRYTATFNPETDSFLNL